VHRSARFTLEDFFGIFILCFYLYCPYWSQPRSVLFDISAYIIIMQAFSVWHCRLSVGRCPSCTKSAENILILCMHLSTQPACYEGSAHVHHAGFSLTTVITVAWMQLYLTANKCGMCQHSEDAEASDSMSGWLSICVYVWPRRWRRMLTTEAAQVAHSDQWQPFMSCCSSFSL